MSSVDLLLDLQNHGGLLVSSKHISGTDKVENGGLIVRNSFDKHQKVESRERGKKKNLYQSHVTRVNEIIFN